MRDTLSVLDQLMVGAVDGVIAHDAAVALLGFTPEALIGEAVDASSRVTAKRCMAWCRKSWWEDSTHVGSSRICWRGCVICWC